MSESERPAENPPGWRKEWRSPKRARARRAQYDSALLALEPLPPFPELRNETLRDLRAIRANEAADSRARVAAAKLLLDATEPDARRELLKLMNGDKRQYLAWLEAEREDCLRELEAEATPVLALPEKTEP